MFIDALFVKIRDGQVAEQLTEQLVSQLSGRISVSLWIVQGKAAIWTFGLPYLGLPSHHGDICRQLGGPESCS